MMNLLTLDVGFEGRSEILRLDYATNWLNLEAVVKCFLDVGDISIKYLDDEHEEICLSSEEELSEAKRVAHKENGVLRLMATRNKSEMKPTQTNNEDTPAQPVETSHTMREACKTNPELPVQCTTLRASSGGGNSSQNCLDLLGAASNLRAAKERRMEEMAAAPLSKTTTHAGITDASQEGQRPEAAIPEELVHQVVRSVLHNLDAAVLNALHGRVSPKATDHSDGVKPAPRVFCHFGIICDCCNKVIVGIRYKCGHCSDYDLCEECEAKEGVHSPSHVFLKLRQPAHKGLGVKPDGRKVALLKRPIYNDDAAAMDGYSLKRREQKMARRAAVAELKRKYNEEKRRHRDARPTMSPSKRERLERMAERQVEEILHAAHVIGGPESAGEAASKEAAEADGTSTPGTDEQAAGNAEKDIPEETSKLLMRWKMDAIFVQDGNLPDDSHMQPGSKFIKQWVMKNSGPVAWDQDTKLKFLWGNMFASFPDVAEVPHLGPSDEGCICVEFVAPSQPGHYQSHWRLAQDGEQFGHRVWCSITVDNPAQTTEKVEDASQEAFSNAVAQLQTNQQDPSIPMRLCSSTEMLTAQDVLSFEMLKISENQAEVEMETEVAALAHQPTPTPHNTPLGVTPCISPVRELDANALSRQMSEHGEVEILEMPSDEEKESDTGAGKEDVEANGTVREPDDDTETVSTGSSEDLLDDFEVVPLPDCFDPSKPLDSSVVEAKSSVTATQTFLSLLSPMPVISKQDAGISAVTVQNTIGTNAMALSTTAHGECQTSPSEQCDAASSASPSSITVGTDVDTLCPTSHGEAQTDAAVGATAAAGARSPAPQAAGSELPASSRCVGTSAGSFLNVASSVTQTESCLSQDATTVAAKPVGMAVATSVDGLFSTVHTEAQTVTCMRQDATTHVRPSATAVATDVDALFTTAHAGAQTAFHCSRDATTATATPSTSTVATGVDALFTTSRSQSQTVPGAVQDAWALSPSSPPAAGVDELFSSTPGSEIHSEPLVPRQAQSPLQIIRIASLPVTVENERPLETDQSHAGVGVISPLAEAPVPPPKIVDVTGQLGTSVDHPKGASQVCGEREQEVFHDAVGPRSSGSQEPTSPTDPNPSTGANDDEQDPMEALGYTAQKAMEFAGGFVKQAFDQAAMSVNALLNPQPLPKQEAWPKLSETADPGDRLVEMGFGNRQRNNELLWKHNNDVSLCVQELLQEQDDAWHAVRH